MTAYLRFCGKAAVGRTCFILLLLSAAAVVPSVSRADLAASAVGALPGSSIHFAGCSQALQIEVNRLLPIEASDGWPGGRLTVFCLGDGRIEVRTDDGQVKRDLPAGASSEPSNGRTIALVLGELLRGPSDPQKVLAEPVPIVNMPAPAPQTASVTSEFSLLAFGQLLGDSNRDALPLGGGLGVAVDNPLIGAWYATGAADASFDRADAERPLGTARTETISSSLMMAAARRWARVQLCAGPIVRAGLVHIKGVSARPDVTASEAWAPLFAPGARVESVLWFGSLGVMASFELSYGLTTSTGVIEGMTPVQVGALSSLLRVGLRWNLSKS